MDGDGLRVIREGHGLTQAQMAKELGVSRQSYIAWEQDRYKMPADKVKLLLEGSETLKAAKPKETDKQRLARESDERELAGKWLDVYRSTRAFYRNHNQTMALFRSQGNVIPQCAYAAIVAEFPDILEDPDGDHPMSPAAARAAVTI